MLGRRITAIAGVLALGTGAFAGTAYSGAQGHDVALRAQNLVVQTQDSNRVVTNTSLASFTADTVTIPATGNYRVLVRFSGESDCRATNWCSAQINVGGIQAHPQSGSDFAFDSRNGNLWESNSFERISDIFRGTGAARQVTVDVLTAVIGGGSWNLDDWTVVAQVYRV